MSLYQIQNFINGKKTQGSGAEMVTLNPATNTVLAKGHESTAADVDAAVKAARAGFEIWKNTPAVPFRKPKLSM